MTPIYPGDFGGHAPGPDAKARDLARQWVVRQDRGLSPAEQAEFDRWRQADPRHEIAWHDAHAVWGLLDAATEHRAAPAPSRPARAWPAWLAAGVGLAAALAVAYVGWWRAPSPATQPAAAVATVVAAADVRVQRLADGTTVYLRPGAEVTVQFTNAVRRVLLVRGTAHFDVAKNAEWPFVVRAGTVEVRAVGTAFNVFVQSDAVQVSVTEGKVRVTPDQAAMEASDASAPLVQAGERAVVSRPDRARPTVSVAPMNPQELAEATAWHQGLVPLKGATLRQVVDDLGRRTGRLIVIADPELEGLEVGGSLSSDLQPEDFVFLLESRLGFKSERAPDGTLTLRKGR
jgi:transmembrane sensor